MVQTDRASKLAQALRSGRTAIVAEYLPTAADADALSRLAAAFPPSLDAVVVASDGALSAVACSTRLAAEGVEPVLTLSTVDRNRSVLLADVRGATLLGVQNVLCLAGDHPSLGASPEAATTSDIDPVQLVQMLRDGATASTLLLGAEVYPQLRPLQLALIDARKKVVAGADFLVTQPIFDLAAFDEWMAAVRAEGLIGRVAVLASVQALTSVEEALTLQRRRHIPDDVIARLRSAGDVATEGIAICAELATKVKGVEGVSGLYIRGSGKPENVADIMRRARLGRVA